MPVRKLRQRLVNRARVVREKLAIARATKSATVNPRPIFILGNQKSGTTAIAALLGALTDVPVTLDLRREYPHPHYLRLQTGRMSFAEFVEFNRLSFSRPIVKEPHLSVFYRDLVRHFPESKFIFVVRDPRDNLRSILNRLHLPGHLAGLSRRQERQLSPAWRLVLDGRWLGICKDNYIEMLAARWNYIADVFLRHSSRMTLIRYEDFLADKQGQIQRLARTLGLTPTSDIASKLDIQYQPAGDRAIRWVDFFGPDNLARIERTCCNRMHRLGYPVST